MLLQLSIKLDNICSECTLEHLLLGCGMYKALHNYLCFIILHRMVTITVE